MGGWAGFGLLPVSSFCPEEVCCHSTSPPYKSGHYGPHTENGYVRKVAAEELTKVGVHLLLVITRYSGSSFLLVLVVAKVFNL